MVRQIEIFTVSLAVVVCGMLSNCVFGQESASVSEKIDAYVDARFEISPTATRELLQELADMGIVDAQSLEKAIRKRRANYPNVEKLAGQFSSHKVDCFHVDYSSTFLMFVPKDHDPNKESSVVVVGHGGNSSMSAARALATAKSYLGLYAPQVSENMNAIVVAPASERGWGPIGYSLIFSTISKVKRMMPIDPDRIYVTGQSMGGHLAYRTALVFPDYWGAVSPHSGGYDFVAKKSIGNLLNVPGLAVFGVREPYGIRKDNLTNADWGEDHGLNWRFVEKNGGHTIYQDELAGMAKFFKANPRNLYRDSVYFRGGGTMKFLKTWGIKGWPEHVVHSETRPLNWNRKHWIEVEPRPEEKTPLELFAKNVGNNRFDIDTNQVRRFSLLLHPKMIDFSKPVTVNVNGREIFRQVVSPDLELMLNNVRVYDDRGKIYWAKVDLEIDSDVEIVVPTASK